MNWDVLAYGALYATLILLWSPLWPLMLGAAVVLGFIAQRLALPALVPIVLLTGATRLLRNQSTSPWLRGLVSALVILLSVGLGAHLLPGFNNLKVIDQARISADGIPFSLYLNFDKTLIGILILGHLHPLLHKPGDWLRMLKIALPRAVPLVLALAALALALRYVAFDPKIPDTLGIWASTNLLLVCPAEEAFFRGFIQRNLTHLLRDFRYGPILALALASLLFGIAHFGGGPSYVLFATLAGAGYGWIYARTQSIEASILTHFLLNLFHFLVLTYPALA